MTEPTTSSPDKISLTKAFIAGSISSSCCWIQLFLNLMASYYALPIGCAGFNKYLGPLRPYTRTITFAWLIMSWSTILSSSDKGEDCCTSNDESSSEKDTKDADTSTTTSASASTSTSTTDKTTNKTTDKTKKTKKSINRSAVYRAFVSTILCLGLTFLPEGLKIMGGPALAPAKVENESNLLTLEYTVNGMSCEGCVHSVEGLLSRQSGVISAKVSNYDLGEVEILINKEWVVDFEKDQFDDLIGGLLDKHGFGLHERGFETEKMKFDNSFVSGNSFM
jgi:copper chaperone CopZ